MAIRSRSDSTSEFGWLVSNGHVICSAELAFTPSAKRRGLIGRNLLDGAMVLSDCFWVHSIGMKFPLDIAFLDSSGKILRIQTLRANRIGIPVRHAKTVIEASAGSFNRWNVKVGDVIEIKTTHETSK